MELEGPTWVPAKGHRRREEVSCIIIERLRHSMPPTSGQKSQTGGLLKSERGSQPAKL